MHIPPSASYKSGAGFHQPKEAAGLSQNLSAFGSSPHPYPFPLGVQEKERAAGTAIFSTQCVSVVLLKRPPFAFCLFTLKWELQVLCAVQLLHMMRSDRAVQSLGSFQSTGSLLRNPARWAVGLTFFPKLF